LARRVQPIRQRLVADEPFPERGQCDHFRVEREHGERERRLEELWYYGVVVFLVKREATLIVGPPVLALALGVGAVDHAQYGIERPMHIPAALFRRERPRPEWCCTDARQFE